MIDYEASLQKFFQLTIKYLEQRKKKAESTRDLRNIDTAITAVYAVANDPKMFADYTKRVAAGIEDDVVADGFIGSGKRSDNSVYLLWSGVKNKMEDLDSDFHYKREKAEKYLLDALKKISYKTSTNVLKDFVHPFLGARHFAVKAKLDDNTR